MATGTLRRARTGPGAGGVPRALLGLVALAPLLVGCGADATVAEPELQVGTLTPKALQVALNRLVRTRYVRVSDKGQMGHSLVVENLGNAALTLSARLVPLGPDGRRVQQADVSGVLGATTARQVLLPGENVDLVLVWGEQAAAVHDVRLKSVEVSRAGTHAAPEVVKVLPIGANGGALDAVRGFTTLALDNPNPFPVTVDAVAVVWTMPDSEASQHVESVVNLVEGAEVPARSRMPLALTPEVVTLVNDQTRRRPVSLRATLVS